MKLIDILVEETIENSWSWPEHANCITQDHDREIMPATCQPCVAKFEVSFNRWFLNGSRIYCFIADVLASDYETAIITREQYEAALAAKNEGWIEWGGGECPVPGDTDVLIKCKSEGAWDCRRKQRADEVSWTHDDSALDVIAYRLHKPQEVAHTEEEQETDLNECIGQDSSTAWSVRWLPSAGCECEYQYKVHGSEWCSFECVAVDGNAAFGWSNNTPIALQLNTHNFRPMRSEAERKRDEAVKAIMLTGWCQTAAEEIYDLIAAGKVPGIKLED
ncbi:hypothetical protein S13e_00052 [Klebsiella phage VLCpiS13e]|uniref:hypothetical protein n=1 Tax=Klebsiella phage VLCpiS13e TaxID=2874889 RepID=UPI00233F5060|nr:hypothetical protein PRB82_gp52 [Klebsiella phage VLCpiS13e]UVX31638.1 hypothetical protein S13e_00052 [Klebsiella phage VLCpiS13e]